MFPDSTEIKILGLMLAFQMGDQVVCLKPHHLDVVRSLCPADPARCNAIAAIKFIRAEYSLGLRSAKLIVDAIRDQMQNDRHWSAN